MTGAIQPQAAWMQKAKRAGWRYGLLAAPLAFAGLPLYVQLPYHYAARLGVSLGVVGAILLVARLLDALIDPWLGRWVDRLWSCPRRQILVWGVMGACLLSAGFAALWWPPAWVAAYSMGVSWWLALALLPTYLGYSSLTIAHNAWGARWGGSASERGRVVAWREAATLVGVMVASAWPAQWGLGTLALALPLGLVLGGWGLNTVALPCVRQAAQGDLTSRALALSPWRLAAFRSLWGTYVFSGVAAAVAATLMPFFVDDYLRARDQLPMFLLLYFAAAAASLPLWVYGVRRYGLEMVWAWSMALAVLAFLAVMALPANGASGSVAGFAAVCLLTGVAAGADLVAPAALLAGVVTRYELNEGECFGWWAMTSKLNLAVAGGLTLMLMQGLGYVPGQPTRSMQQILVLLYALLPCLLKLVSALLLWRFKNRFGERTCWV